MKNKSLFVFMCIRTHTNTHAIVTLWKVRRKLSFVQFGFEYV